MRDFKVIENEKIKKKEVKQSALATNPIAKKFIDFQNKEKFSVKDLFKK